MTSVSRNWLDVGCRSEHVSFVISSWDLESCETYFDDDKLDTSTDHILTVLSSPPEANWIPGPLAIATDRTMSR